ncbi:MAG: adk, adenylate kinase, adenylate kinase [Candidatus Nomurabacteria bacterium]|nr:adk, adenylate kinase, adenylate kinase [Candidatus Nomurabacteria bacterium]
MDKQFFILIGRSGSGKGTQADSLKAYLEKKGASKVIHITTGGAFRKFIEGETHAGKLAKEITNSGGLLPEFLAVWNWSNIFIESIEGNETILLDGAPRRMVEVEAIHSALHFFGYDHATVVYIDVSESWALDKLSSRGREDDASLEDTRKKMEWFNEDVLPVLDHYSRDPLFKYIHVNGEQTVEEVHNEIVAKLEVLN